MTDTMGGIVFHDRIDAGHHLASRLLQYKSDDPLILALPRGGVIVAAEVARELDAELDVIVARKVGAPDQPELGIGAVAPGGVQLYDDFAIRYLNISSEQLQRITAAETEEMNRRLALYRGARPLPRVEGRTVVLIDDGLATGVTARAAIRCLRQRGPRKLILAVPVCAGETAATLHSEVDEIVCVSTPPYFRAVGYWYRDFSQTTDEEVISALEQARARHHEGAEMAPQNPANGNARQVQIASGSTVLHGNLTLPANARSLVLFAHGSGSSRHSPRNRYVASALQQRGLGTLLMDLLSQEEEATDLQTRHLRFDIGLLAERLLGAIQWLAHKPETEHLRIGLFGASTGAGAALVAAARQPDMIGAVVSRGGRPDLAGEELPRVHAPTLLIVGGNDHSVIDLNRQALAQLCSAEKRLEIIPSATHLFEEPGTLEQAAILAADWFERYLKAMAVPRAA